MKKILFLSGKWSDLGGLNKMISIIASSLSHDYEVTVCSMDICHPGEGYKLDSKVKYIEFLPTELYNLPKILKDLDIDIFVGSNNCDKAYLSLYRELSNTKIKTVMWNHEFYFLPFINKELWEISLFRRDIFRYPDAIIWLTKTSTKVCQQYSSKVWTIGNCIMEDQVKPVKAEQDKPLNVISIGRFDSRQKGIGYLLCMFKELLKLNPDARLYVVGRYNLSLKYSDYSSETVEQLLESLQIPLDRLNFIGEVKDITPFLNKSFINVMTSEMEGFGLTILEAARSGVPSIIFSGGGSSDIISDGENGFVVRFGDYIEMAKKINELFQNESLYKSIQQKMQILIDTYSLESIKSKWINMLESLGNVPKLSASDRLLPETKKIISLYEYILLRKIREQGNFLEYSLDIHPSEEKSSKNFLSYKCKYGLKLIKSQGILQTLKNLFSKLKSKIK